MSAFCPCLKCFHSSQTFAQSKFTVSSFIGGGGGTHTQKCSEVTPCSTVHYSSWLYSGGHLGCQKRIWVGPNAKHVLYLLCYLSGPEFLGGASNPTWGLFKAVEKMEALGFTGNILGSKLLNGTSHPELSVSKPSVNECPMQTLACSYGSSSAFLCPAAP